VDIPGQFSMQRHSWHRRTDVDRRRRRVASALLAVAALVLGASLVAPAAAVTTTSTHTKVVRNCLHASVTPRRIIVACGDGNFYLARLHWRHWGGFSARGAGVAWKNDCIPDCARGTFHHYRVRVTLTRVWASKGFGWLFHRANLYYPHRHPDPRRHEHVKLPPY
jgi:hypothetical protein